MNNITDGVTPSAWSWRGSTDNLTVGANYSFTDAEHNEELVESVTGIRAVPTGRRLRRNLAPQGDVVLKSSCPGDRGVQALPDDGKGRMHQAFAAGRRPPPPQPPVPVGLREQWRRRWR